MRTGRGTSESIPESFVRDLTDTRQQHRIRIDPIAVVTFTYDQATRRVTAPGILPFTAHDLNDARDTVRSLFDKRADA